MITSFHPGPSDWPHLARSPPSQGTYVTSLRDPRGCWVLSFWSSRSCPRLWDKLLHHRGLLLKTASTPSTLARDGSMYTGLRNNTLPPCKNSHNVMPTQLPNIDFHDFLHICYAAATFQDLLFSRYSSLFGIPPPSSDLVCSTFTQLSKPATKVFQWRLLQFL